MNPWTIIILIGATSGAIFLAIMIRAWHEGNKDKDNSMHDIIRRHHHKSSNHAKDH